MFKQQIVSRKTTSYLKLPVLGLLSLKLLRLEFRNIVENRKSKRSRTQHRTVDFLIRKTA